MPLRFPGFKYVQCRRSVMHLWHRGFAPSHLSLALRQASHARDTRLLFGAAAVSSDVAGVRRFEL